MKRAELSQVLRVLSAATLILVCARNLELAVVLCGLSAIIACSSEIAFCLIPKRASVQFKEFFVCILVSSLTVAFELLAFHCAGYKIPAFGFSAIALSAWLLVWGRADGTVRWRIRLRNLLYFVGLVLAAGEIRQLSRLEMFGAAPFLIVALLAAFFLFLRRRGLE